MMVFIYFVITLVYLAFGCGVVHLGVSALLILSVRGLVGLHVFGFFCVLGNVACAFCWLLGYRRVGGCYLSFWLGCLLLWCLGVDLVVFGVDMVACLGFASRLLVWLGSLGFGLGSATI